MFDGLLTLCLWFTKAERTNIDLSRLLQNAYNNYLRYVRCNSDLQTSAYVNITQLQFPFTYKMDIKVLLTHFRNAWSFTDKN